MCWETRRDECGSAASTIAEDAFRTNVIILLVFMQIQLHIGVGLCQALINTIHTIFYSQN